MAQRERFSIGPSGMHAEGPRTSFYVVTLVAIGLGTAFYLGKLSALLDACFGLKF